MQQVLKDLEAAVAAVQAKGRHRLRRDAIDRVDEARFQPLIDVYNHNLKIVAGG